MYRCYNLKEILKVDLNLNAKKVIWLERFIFGVMFYELYLDLHEIHEALHI